MKKNIVLILFVFSMQFCYTQCLLTFNELKKSTNYNQSDFETFALKKGFSYNSYLDAFVCDNEYSQGANVQLRRYNGENNSNLIQYIFFQKSQYLDYKTALENKGRLENTNVENNSLISKYIYDNRLVMLTTKTIESITVYLIAISNEKLNKIR